MLWWHVTLLLGVSLVTSASHGTEKSEVGARVLADHYPAQYVVYSLQQGQTITIDGHLDEEAWSEVPWLDNFLDLAGPRYANKGTKTWQEASKEYAQRFTGSSNPTRVKVRWDDNFLYIGAELKSRHVSASVTGHCDSLRSDVWKDTPVLPYFDDDFEVFLNPSQDNYFYVEFEVNARNATYDTLWSLPQAGLGSVAPECGGGDGPRRFCCNTTWNHGKGLCDKPPVEHEAGIWTMEMYNPTQRPGSGMVTAATNHSDIWSLELRFPILSDSNHGGIINLGKGQSTNSNPKTLHPSTGQKFWWATFANALHAPWWSHLNTTTTKDPAYIKELCQKVIQGDDNRNGGFSQFLVDANNAAPTCYYEAASQDLGGHQYMHNPDSYGYLQFSNHAPQQESEKECRNVQWWGRFALAQIYQAQVQYLINEKLGNGTFTTNMNELLAPEVCTINNACNSTALRTSMEIVQVSLWADPKAKIGKCARYAVGTWQQSSWTGGPCFNATVTYSVQAKEGPPTKRRHITGVIDEARQMRFNPEVGQRWNDPDEAWLCLDDVVVNKH